MLWHLLVQVAKAPADITFVEMYGGGAILHGAESRRRSLHREGLKAFDLRMCKPNGARWDFDLEADREEARAYVLEFKLDWIVGSPPCTAFCLLDDGLVFFPKWIQRRWRE